MVIRCWNGTCFKCFSSQNESENQDMLAGSFILGQIVMGSYLTVIFRSRSTETSFNGRTKIADVSIIMLEFVTLMVGFTTVLLGVSNLMTSYHYFEFQWGMPILQRDIWDRVNTSNTSPDSCVIDVKVGVVSDPVQSDSSIHVHSDALILPVS